MEIRLIDKNIRSKHLKLSLKPPCLSTYSVIGAYKSLSAFSVGKFDTAPTIYLCN
jgi:hypothetical protein